MLPPNYNKRKLSQPAMWDSWWGTSESGRSDADVPPHPPPNNHHPKPRQMVDASMFLDVCLEGRMGVPRTISVGTEVMVPGSQKRRGVVSGFADDCGLCIVTLAEPKGTTPVVVRCAPHDLVVAPYQDPEEWAGQLVVSLRPWSRVRLLLNSTAFGTVLPQSEAGDIHSGEMCNSIPNSWPQRVAVKMDRVSNVQILSAGFLDKYDLVYAEQKPQRVQNGQLVCPGPEGINESAYLFQRVSRDNEPCAIGTLVSYHPERGYKVVMDREGVDDQWTNTNDWRFVSVGNPIHNIRED